MVFESFRGRKKFKYQFGELEVLNEGKSYRIDERLNFSLSREKDILIGIGVLRQSKKPYRIKYVHLLPGKPTGLESFPDDWDVAEYGGRYSIEWPEEIHSKSNLKHFCLSPTDPTGEYMVEIYIDGILENTITFQVNA